MAERLEKKHCGQMITQQTGLQAQCDGGPGILIWCPPWAPDRTSLGKTVPCQSHLGTAISQNRCCHGKHGRCKIRKLLNKRVHSLVATMGAILSRMVLGLAISVLYIFSWEGPGSGQSSVWGGELLTINLASTFQGVCPEGVWTVAFGGAKWDLEAQLRPAMWATRFSFLNSLFIICVYVFIHVM